MHVAGGESRCILLPTMCAPVKEASTAHSYSQAQALRPRGVIKRRDRGTGGLHNTLTTTAQQINHFVEPDQWPRSINIKLAHQDQAKRTFSLAVVARSLFAIFHISIEVSRYCKKRGRPLNTQSLFESLPFSLLYVLLTR